MPETLSFDTAVIGGGPAGSTVASVLRKYDVNHRVAVFERERFPREHVGESQLPLIGQILDEIGVWDKVEAENFPIKIGATYRWGSTPETWNFEFVANGIFHDEPRPGRYEGQRTRTAFQVDRGRYDKVLLDHSRSLGAEVFEETRILKIEVEGDRVVRLVLADGRHVEARYFVDASGGSALLRRAFNIGVDSPTSLRNIAIWDYWQNADWAVEIGVGGTRVQVMSLGYGWIWFIPLSETRTSVGLIVPADYYKSCGKTPQELYLAALQEEPRISALMVNAVSEGNLSSTNDWSYVADRLVGENWFLAGDCCGFADPILAAGMTLAHAGAREVAYCIRALDQGDHDPTWLREIYDIRHRKRIRQHIQFADFWYSANGQFSDLIDYTSVIAKGAGLDLTPEKAFQWLGTGGFANDDLGYASIGTFSLSAVKQMAQLMTGEVNTWKINKFNEFRLNLGGAVKAPFAVFREGEIIQANSYQREGKVLPMMIPYNLVFEAVYQSPDLRSIMASLEGACSRTDNPKLALMRCLHTLEAMLTEGWVTGRLNKKKPTLNLKVEDETDFIYFEHSASAARS